MTTVLIVVSVVSAALLLGALWGLYGTLGPKLEGFLVALGGGALILSCVLELIEPAREATSLGLTAGGVLAGAVLFTAVDYLIDEIWSDGGGLGLLAAISLDGIPENLALGVALIGAGVNEVAALAGSILLSNLPEAAGGAKRMREDGWDRRGALLLWAGTAAVLGLAAVGGNALLSGVGEEVLAAIRAVAAGAVIASLATEVFPQAYRRDAHTAGIATTVGLLLALALVELGG